MKMRIAFPLLFALLCLTLSAVPAMADNTPSPKDIIELYNTGGPELPSPVGSPLNHMFDITSASWFCPYADCDVTEVTFWAFDGTTGKAPNPSAIDFRVGPQPYAVGGTMSGTAVPVLVSPPGCIQGEVAFCEFDIGFGRSIDVPHGLNYLQLWNLRNSPSSSSIYWSANDFTGQASTTCETNPRTGVTRCDMGEAPLAFRVFGSPTRAVIPEPSSMMLLGSGVLGLAGVLRRKLIR